MAINNAPANPFDQFDASAAAPNTPAPAGMSNPFDHFDAGPAATDRPAPTSDDIMQMARTRGVDPYLALAIYSQESGRSNTAPNSDKGAVGGFQVMPATGAALAGRLGYQPDLKDPWQNADVGIEYLKYGQDTLGLTDPMLLAAGYHQGYRSNLAKGLIDNTSDGHILTRDYAAQVVARRQGILNSGVQSADRQQQPAPPAPPPPPLPQSPAFAPPPAMPAPPTADSQQTMPNGIFRTQSAASPNGAFPPSAGQGVTVAPRSPADIVDNGDSQIASQPGAAGGGADGANRSVGTLALDLGEKAAGSVLSGLGYSVNGMLRMLSDSPGPLRAGVNLMNTLAGSFLHLNPKTDIGDWISAQGQKVDAMRSDATKQDEADTAIKGNIFSADDWRNGKVTLGDRPNVWGYVNQGVGILGIGVPQVATAIATHGASVGAQLTSGATVGAATGIGMAADMAKQWVASKNDDQLAQASQAYRDLVASGVAPDEARARVSEAAQRWAGFLAAPVAGFGGMAYQATLGKVGTAALAGMGSNALARIATTTVATALEGGAVGAAQQAATNAGINAGAGADEDIGRDTAAAAVMGAIGAAVPGFAKAVLTPGKGSAARGGGHGMDDLGTAEDILGGGGGGAQRFNPNDRPSTTFDEHGNVVFDAEAPRLPFITRSAAQSEAERTGGTVEREGDRFYVRPGEKPEPTQPAPAPAPAPNEPEAGAPISFTTAKGSTYRVEDDGTTTRDKAWRKEHGDDAGAQPRSESTFYVDDSGLNALAEFGAHGGPGNRRIVVSDDGRAGIQYRNGSDLGKIESRTVTPISTEPAIGLYPVELWDNGSVAHFGNRITQITRGAGAAAPTAKSAAETPVSAPPAPASAPTAPRGNRPITVQQPGDILGTNGQPFITLKAAQKVADARGLGHDVLRVDRGYVVRQRDVTTDELSTKARNDFLGGIREAGGISIKIAPDILGEGGKRAYQAYPGLFRKEGGMLEDGLATHLHERGYLNDSDVEAVGGGAQKALDLVGHALNGGAVYTPEQEMAAAEAAVREDQELHDLHSELEPGIMESSGFSDAAPEEQSVAVALATQDGDIQGVPVSEADFLRAMGMSDEEIRDFTAASSGEGSQPSEPAQDAGRAPARDQGGHEHLGREKGSADAVPERPFDLITAGTPDEARRRTRKEEITRRDKERRDGAPEPGDIAEAHGQRSLDMAPHEIDANAHEAATSPHNGLPLPTQAQKDAGNYKMGHVKVHGLDVTIENPRGSTRSGIDRDGARWEVKILDHYGYLKGTEGNDGDHIDAFIGKDLDSDRAFVVDQVHPDNGEFDEHKVMLGYDSLESARAAYLQNYEKGWQGLGSITPASIEELKSWLANGDMTKPYRDAMGLTPESDAVAEKHAQIDRNFAANREALKSLNVGDAVEYTDPGTYTNKDGSKTEGRVISGKIERIDDARQGRVKVGTASVPARLLRKAQPEGNEGAAVAGENDGSPGRQPGADFGANNKTFTKDRADRARDLLRKKLPQLNSGIDPEMIQAGIEIAGFYVEGGARKFADYSAKMLADLGEAARPFLKSWYLAVRNYPGFDRAGMESEADIERAEAAAPAPKSADALLDPRADRLELARALGERIEAGDIKSINDARKYLTQRTGLEFKGGTPEAKIADEIAELAVVQAARRIAGAVDEGAAYDRLVDLYDKQPNLNVRTSTSVEQQAYSTPAPLAYLASRLAGIGGDRTVYEPTAGNGMLLIQADPDHAIVNELNPDRAAALRAQGFDVTEENAATWRPAKPYSDVITNPPFGIVKDDGGNTIRFSAPSALAPNGTYQTSEIDHAIALEALRAMPDDGRAALILGGINKLTAVRENGYNGKAKREFYYTLYNDYNVVDHFTANGDLYAKQGAAWPVDVIVIQGRGKSALPLPSVQAPQVFDSWGALKEKLNASYRVGTEGGEHAPAQQPSSPPTRNGSSGGGDLFDDAGAPERDQLAPSGIGGGSSNGIRQGQRGTNGARDSGTNGADSVSGDRGLRDNRGGRAGGASATPGGGNPDAADGRAARRNAVDDLARNDAGKVAEPGDDGTDGKSRPVERRKEQASAGQADYEPTSKVSNIGTLVPANMRTAIADSLHALEGRVGDIDQFVAGELDYPVGDLGKYFSAEQVDALGLAIDAIKQGGGFVIGDQTGIGKGRVNAGIMRWSMQNGKTPIFVTHKPNLYADMYRDLTDIGMPNVRILMTNADEEVPLDDDGEHVLKTPAGAKHNANLDRMVNDHDLEGHDVIFSTYDSLNTVKGAITPRMRLVQAFAPGVILILDESHNAGGSMTDKSDSRAPTNVLNRSTFFRQLVNTADGVFYSSATYAKRPSVMDLYAKTKMSEAVEKPAQLGEAIMRGGVPLQQVVAAMLARSGQYIRRERTFAGVTYEPVVVDVNRKMAENAASVMRGIMQFDRLKKVAVDQLSRELRAEAKGISVDGSTGGAGASSTNFTSIMHNVINQMLLGLKVKPATDMAIEALKRGEKPVITVANTMGSMLKEFAEKQGIKPGEHIPMHFGDLLERYLERSRDIIIKQPFKRGSVVKRLSDDELGKAAVHAFNEIRDSIRAADWSSLPISPIDYIKGQLNKAGYKAAEITGRSGVVDYMGGKPVYRVRPAVERKIKGRLQAIRQFNDGKVDVMILNQAGSTGLSLHASPKVGSDVRRRHMIIAQPEANIDTHMQMLGRVHRTGQVVAPRYSQVIADVPAEKRPAAVLAKKMASLNANTTASRTSALSSDRTPDFINQYGDEVVAALMDADQDLHRRLGEPLKHAESGDGFEHEDAAQKVTGRIPVLPLDEQEQIYRQIEDDYHDLLKQKEAMGENALEAKTLPLDAELRTEMPLVEGRAGSEFAGPVMASVMNVKRLGKPYAADQVLSALQEKTGAVPAQFAGDKVKSLAWMADHEKTAAKERARQVHGDFRTWLRGQTLDMEDDRQRGVFEAKANDAYQKFEDLSTGFAPGTSVELRNPNGTILYGIVTNIERKGTAKNPAANGAWRMNIALADAARNVTLPFSKLATTDAMGMVRITATTKEALGTPIIHLFDHGQSLSREDRTFITGNLLKAYAHIGAGQIVNFTSKDGGVHQGIMMSRGYDANREAARMKRKAEAKMDTTEKALKFLAALPGNRVGDVEDTVNLARGRKTFGATWNLEVPASKSAGADVFLNPQLRDLFGDFIKRGNKMVAKFEDHQLPAVLNVLTGLRDLRGFKSGESPDNLESRIVPSPRALQDMALPGFRHLDDGMRPTLDQIKSDAERALGFASPVPVEMRDLAPNVIQAFDSGDRVIAVNPRNALDRGAAAQAMTEEVLHAIDNTGTPNRQVSASAERLRVQFGENGPEGVGDLAKEAVDLWRAGGPLSGFFAYPLDPKHALSASRIQAELFARMGTLYLGHPAALKRLAPKIYEAYDELFHALRSGPDAGSALHEGVSGSGGGLVSGRETRGSTADERGVFPTGGASTQGRQAGGLLGVVGDSESGSGGGPESGLRTHRGGARALSEIARIFGGDERGAFVQQPLNSEGEAGANFEARSPIDLYRERAETFIDRVDSLMNPILGMPAINDYLKDRYETMGRIGAANEKAKLISNTIGKATPEDKQAIYDYLTTAGADTSGIKDPAMARAAANTKALLGSIGDALVDRGLLSEESREEYRDRYLPRLYLKHLLNEGDARTMGASKSPSSMGYLKARKDIPEEIRKVILGEITDPGFLAAMGVTRPMRDMALLDFLTRISRNREWVLPRSIVDFGGQRVTPQWLKAEATRLRTQAQYMPDQHASKARALAERMDSAADLALHDMGINGEHADYRQVPDSPRYGRLRGLWIRKEIFDDLVGNYGLQTGNPNWAENLFGYGGVGTKATQLWKSTKATMNVPTQIRNFISNAVMMQLSGTPLHMVPTRLIQAINEIVHNGDYWRRAQRYGVATGTFAANELYRMKTDLLKLSLQGGGFHPIQRLMLIGGHIMNFSNDAYQMSEAVSKTAKFIDAIKREGMNDGDAALAAQKWLFDHSLVPAGIRYARNAPVGAPFMTYNYKLAPRLLEVAATAPHRFLPWMALLAGLPYAAAMALGGQADDWRKFIRMLPQFLREKGHMAVLPFRDAAGRIQAVDLSPFFPWAHYLEMMNTFKHIQDEGPMKTIGDLASDVGMFGGPVTDAITALTTNKDGFTGRDIVPPGGSFGQKSVAALNYVYNMMAPPFLTDSGLVSPMGLFDKQYGGKAVQAGMGTTNKFGDPRQTLGQAAANLAGVNIYGSTPADAMSQQLGAYKQDIDDVRTLLKQRLMDRSLTPDQRQALTSEALAEIQRRQEKITNYLAGFKQTPEMASVR